MRTIERIRCVAVLSALVLGTIAVGGEENLRVSGNKHYLETTSGSPFLYLGDTEWVLNKHSDSQIIALLDDRAAKGFTVIQVWSSRYWDGAFGGYRTWAKTDYNNNVPFIGDDCTQFNAAYWNRLLWLADRCDERGLHLALHIGGVGRPDHGPWYAGTSDRCYVYGRQVGNLFRNKTNIIFNIGQDMAPTDGIGLAGWRAIAEGVADGVNGANSYNSSADYGTTFMTFHSNSDYWAIHGDSWLDANGIELWHNNGGVFGAVNYGYNLAPLKPMLMVEGMYEDEVSNATPHYIRVEAWHTYFAGGAGYGYGHCQNWQQFASITYIDDTAAGHMDVMAAFLNGREWWKLVPDQGMITSNVGSGASRRAAVRSTDGDECYVYFPTTGGSSIAMNRITTAANVTATWLDPRNGATQAAGSYAITQTPLMTPPAWEDAVLILKAAGGAPTTPRIAVSRTTISVTAIQGTNPDPETFQVWNSGVNTLTYTIDEASSLYSVSPTGSSSTGTGDKKTHTITFATSALNVGSEQRTFTVSSGGADNSPVSITIYFTIIEAPTPGIGLSTKSISASAVLGNNAASTAFDVWNSGTGTLTYNESNDAEWVSVSPSSGTSSGSYDRKTHTVTFPSAGLALGTYNALITIVDVAATNSPQTIAVTLQVTAAPLFTAYNDLSWGTGQLTSKITRYTTDTGTGTPPEGYTGLLKDYATGTSVPGVTLTVTGGDWNGETHAGQGAEPAAGTPADVVFGGKVNCLGVVSYGTPSATLTFSGLSSSGLFTLVLYNNRALYTGVRWTTYVISGASSFVNASSAGATISTTAMANDTTQIDADNTASGYIAKYKDIAPGSDGTFVVTVGGVNPYVSALMLEAQGGTGPTQPTVAFAASTSSQTESVTPANIAVNLSAASTSAVTVNYSVTGGTATRNTDYTLSDGTLNFAAGQTSKNIAIVLSNDTAQEANETVQLTLSSPSGATLGSPTAHTFTVLDDDSAPAGGFTAYNDLSWDVGQSTVANATTIGGGGQGLLKNFDTGAQLGVTLQITGGSHYNGTERNEAPASGTDAYNVFNGKVDCIGTLFSGAAFDIVLSGLSSANKYEVVIFGNRNGGTDYLTRLTKTTIQGAKSFVNAGTSGSTISTVSVANDTTTIPCGYNTETGYVFRYRDIDPDTDETFTLHVDLEGSTLYLNALMLKETAETAGDADGDGMTDSWETTYFGGTSVTNGGAQDDWDHDGMCNLDEFKAGTNPASASDVLALTSIVTSGADFSVVWKGISGKSYAIYGAATIDALLSGGTLLYENIAGTAGNNTHTVPSEGREGCYRVLLDQ